jgi:hypothetical protein
MTAPGKSTNQLDPFIDYTDLSLIDARTSVRSSTLSGDDYSTVLSVTQPIRLLILHPTTYPKFEAVPLVSYSLSIEYHVSGAKDRF